MKYLSLTLVMAAICLSACNQAPDTEVQTARSALAAARKLGADQSAPAQISQAARLLDSALQEIEKQGKSIIGQDYSVAKKLLLEAGAMAQEAGMRAAAGANPAAKPVDSGATKAVAAQKADSAAKDSGVAQAKLPAEVLSEKPTLDVVEAKVNRVYAMYQKPPKQPNGAVISAAEREKSLADLKAAQAAIKTGDFAGAMRSAAQAEARLTGIPAPAVSKP